MALLFYRAVLGAPLPEALRPSWFILLVPPALIYANGIALYPGNAFLENLFYAALILALALLFTSRNFLKWQFGPPWWAFTFPLDALAYAAARYALDHPSPLWRGVCAATLALATLAVALVLVRSAAALARLRQ
jgi:tellurite resistance protein